MAENKNIERFEQLLRSTNRDGIENLISFIQKSDFYTAPASTRFHSCHEGGLLEHTLLVYDRLISKFNDELWKEKVDVKQENLIISALLHDICKTYFYNVSLRNAKNDETGKWEKVPYYTVEDKIPYGHGEKSAMMAEEFIRLEPVERYAIRWHMGFTEPKENWNVLGCAIRKYPLILALHTSDLEATYLLEKEE